MCSPLLPKPSGVDVSAMHKKIKPNQSNIQKKISFRPLEMYLWSLEPLRGEVQDVIVTHCELTTVLKAWTWKNTKRCM